MRRFGGALALMMAVAAATLAPAASAAPAGVTIEAAESIAPNRYLWVDDASLEPVNIVVSIADQRAYVYRGAVLIAVSSVSTGREGKETPAGTYPILQKREMHKSNLYDAAPMPFMQRLTWDGIALHAGRNPGFADSHGCIRLPAAFARKLFAVTDVGTLVTVMEEAFVPPEDGWTPPAPTYQPADDPIRSETAETGAANERALASLER